MKVFVVREDENNILPEAVFSTINKAVHYLHTKNAARAHLDYRYTITELELDAEFPVKPSPVIQNEKE